MTINAWEERQQFVALLHIIQFNQKRLQYFSSGNLGHNVVVNVTENQYLIIYLFESTYSRMQGLFYKCLKQFKTTSKWQLMRRVLVIFLAPNFGSKSVVSSIQDLFYSHGYTFFKVSICYTTKNGV